MLSIKTRMKKTIENNKNMKVFKPKSLQQPKISIRNVSVKKYETVINCQKLQKSSIETHKTERECHSKKKEIPSDWTLELTIKGDRTFISGIEPAYKNYN